MRGLGERIHRLCVPIFVVNALQMRFSLCFLALFHDEMCAHTSHSGINPCRTSIMTHETAKSGQPLSNHTHPQKFGDLQKSIVLEHLPCSRYQQYCIRVFGNPLPCSTGICHFDQTEETVIKRFPFLMCTLEVPVLPHFKYAVLQYAL